MTLVLLLIAGLVAAQTSAGPAAGPSASTAAPAQSTAVVAAAPSSKQRSCLALLGRRSFHSAIYDRQAACLCQARSYC